FPQGRGRLPGFANDLPMIERREFAALAQNAAVHDHRIDIRRLRQRDDRLVGIADRRHVRVGGAYKNNVGPLAGAERAGLLGNAEIDRAVDLRELNQPFQGKAYLVTDAVLVQREQNAHGDERIAVVVGGVVGREAGLDTRFQQLAELDHADARGAPRLADWSRRIAHAARFEDGAL